MKRYSSGHIPMAIAYTKIDIMPKEAIAEDAKKLYEASIDCDVFPVSARKYQNIKKLEAYLAEKMPEGHRVISEDIVSDKSEKFMIAEIMREKILLKFDEEIPHGIAIVVNAFERKDNGKYDIQYVERSMVFYGICPVDQLDKKNAQRAQQTEQENPSEHMVSFLFFCQGNFYLRRHNRRTSYHNPRLKTFLEI